MTRWTRTLLAFALALAAIPAAGCAVYPGTARPASFEDLRRDEGWVLLDSVPWVEQASRTGCGAACLAMVLGSWGIEAPVEALEKECGVDAKDGIRATALRDAARRRGLSAFLLAGTLKDIEHELSRGRPVLVGLSKPRGDGFTSHFQVVVGLDAARARIAALDPAIGLMCDSLEGFEAEWRRTKGVTLVMFRPEARVVFAGLDGSRQGGGP
jgi:ABC-type bacteriocin/lantibiotic exporter with double-glycine peptidase domain